LDLNQEDCGELSGIEQPNHGLQFKMRDPAILSNPIGISHHHAKAATAAMPKVQQTGRKTN